MSEYRGIARWSKEAVGMINWDDQAKEGTAQVTDEKTGTVYEIGGGGGKNDFSTAEVTIINTRNNSRIEALSAFIEDDALIVGKYALYGETKLRIVLYKGETQLICDANEITSTSGDLEEIDTGTYKVTGNCTITGAGANLPPGSH